MRSYCHHFTPSPVHVLSAFREHFSIDNDVSGTLVSADVLARRQQDARESARSFWSLDALSGRLCELSAHGAGAAFSALALLAAQAQRRGELVAWVSAGPLPFAPDLERNGLDLRALLTVRAPDASAAARAAERLLRAACFGLVVVDLAEGAELPPALAGRLMHQSQRGGAALVFIRRQPRTQPSLSSLIHVRIAAERQRCARGSLVEGAFVVELEVLKDKRRGPGALQQEIFDGTPGLY